MPVVAWLMKANIVAEPSGENQLVPFGTFRNIIQRAAPDSDVRSSTQSTTVLPASAAGCVLPFSPPGRGGAGWNVGGIGDRSLGIARSPGSCGSTAATGRGTGRSRRAARRDH